MKKRSVVNNKRVIIGFIDTIIPKRNRSNVTNHREKFYLCLADNVVVYLLLGFRNQGKGI
jgi:hypothetical protein